MSKFQAFYLRYQWLLLHTHKKSSSQKSILIQFHTLDSQSQADFSQTVDVCLSNRATSISNMSESISSRPQEPKSTTWVSFYQICFKRKRVKWHTTYLASFPALLFIEMSLTYFMWREFHGSELKWFTLLTNKGLFN